MTPLFVDCYRDDLSIDELMNRDLWTLLDSEEFTQMFSETTDDEWPEEFDEEPSAPPVVYEDDERFETPDCDDPFDWFNEFGKVYDV